MDRRSFLRRGAATTAAGLVVAATIPTAPAAARSGAPVYVDQELDPIVRGLRDDNVRFELRYYQRWAHVWWEVQHPEIRVDMELDPILRPVTSRERHIGADCEQCGQFHYWYVHGCAPVVMPIGYEPPHGWEMVGPAQPTDVPLAVSQECGIQRLGPHLHTFTWEA